jgi:hypothetical protein
VTVRSSARLTSSLPTDGFSAAEFLVRRMYRALDIDPPFSAIAETENLGDDNWFWTDDNAKVLEFLSRPEIWQRFPDQTNEILRFVRSMCRGPFILRRVSAPRLDLTERHGCVASYRHSLMQLKFDTSSGLITVGMRFHDERNADSLSFTGNYVQFSYRRRRFRIPLERFDSATHTKQNEHVLQLQHSAALDFTFLWKRIRLGEITYTYTVDARSMLIDVQVALDLHPGIQVSDVILTIGHGLSHRYFRNIVTDKQTATTPIFTARGARRAVMDDIGASYYAIRQRQSSGDSIALHSVPRASARLSGIEAVVRTRGRLHSAAARYAFSGPHRGGRLVAAESKLLTAGGFYDRVDDYVGFIDEAAGAKTGQRAAYDFSISYDYGVVINAFAKCFAACTLGGAQPQSGVDRDELRSLVDLHLDFYFKLYVDQHQKQPNVIFSRELSFVILALMTMYRATHAEDYHRRLRRLCDVLLEFELRFDAIADHPASGFLMRMDSPRVAYVDCQSAALLALTLAARHISDPRFAAAIDRGLESYCVETCRYDGGIVDTVAALMVDSEGVRRTENGFWNFKVGLTLRFFAALRNASEPGLRTVAARHRERIELLEVIMRRQLERSVAEYDDGLEIRCSPLSGETNSETQPWVMLGLIGHPDD